jgi:hypothetical protein
VRVRRLDGGRIRRRVDVAKGLTVSEFDDADEAFAADLMRDLIRSPANQATKSLRSALIGPPLRTEGARPPASETRRR